VRSAAARAITLSIQRSEIREDADLIAGGLFIAQHLTCEPFRKGSHPEGSRDVGHPERYLEGLRTLAADTGL
jgi:hypothetical protein